LFLDPINGPARAGLCREAHCITVLTSHESSTHKLLLGYSGLNCLSSTPPIGACLGLDQKRPTCLRGRRACLSQARQCWTFTFLRSVLFSSLLLVFYSSCAMFFGRHFAFCFAALPSSTGMSRSCLVTRLHCRSRSLPRDEPCRRMSLSSGSISGGVIRTHSVRSP